MKQIHESEIYNLDVILGIQKEILRLEIYIIIYRNNISKNKIPLCITWLVWQYSRAETICRNSLRAIGSLTRFWEMI
jgi:hypothetical protein